MRVLNGELTSQLQRLQGKPRSCPSKARSLSTHSSEGRAAQGRGHILNPTPEDRESSTPVTEQDGIKAPSPTWQALKRVPTASVYLVL